MRMARCACVGPKPSRAYVGVSQWVPPPIPARVNNNDRRPYGHTHQQASQDSGSSMVLANLQKHVQSGSSPIRYACRAHLGSFKSAHTRAIVLNKRKRRSLSLCTVL